LTAFALPPIHSPRGGWSFTLYPDAGEGGGTWRSAKPRASNYVAKGSAADPERARQEAGRRARSRLRRYCAANRLSRLGTLTYRGDGEHDPARIRADLGAFFRELRSQLGGQPLPYAWVPEWHKSGHGLHAHFAVGRYIKRSQIEAAWPHGFVHIKLLGGLPTGTTSLGEARRAGGYLSKYVAKSFGDSRFTEFGMHRYDVAQGFAPVSASITGQSSANVLAQASLVMAGRPSTLWTSAEADDWQAPPAIWAQWGA